MRTSIKIVATISTAAVVVSTAGIAYAAWNAGGVSGVGSQGNGKAKAKQALQVATTTPADLYPTKGLAPNTDVPGTVGFSVNNPNPYDVAITSATITGVSSPLAACTPALSDFVIGATSITTPQAVRNNGTDAAGTITITSVNNSLDDDCADTDLNFQVTVAGASAPGQS